MNPTASRILLLSLLLPGLASSALPSVEYRKEPTAIQRVGDLLLDAKGNRVMAESLGSAAYLVVFLGADGDVASRDFAQKLAQRYQASFDTDRWEVVVLSSASQRGDLLRLLRGVDAHWYGVDPVAPAATSLATLFPSRGVNSSDVSGPAVIPSLLLLNRMGERLAVNDPKGPFPSAHDVLKELERRLALDGMKPDEKRVEEKKIRQAERTALAKEMKANPSDVPEEKIRELYPVEGMLKVKGVPHAMINQRMVAVGEKLDNGARIVAIEGANVIVEVGGRRITLEPAPIKGANGR